MRGRDGRKRIRDQGRKGGGERKKQEAKMGKGEMEEGSRKVIRVIIYGYTQKKLSSSWLDKKEFY